MECPKFEAYKNTECESFLELPPIQDEMIKRVISGFENLIMDRLKTKGYEFKTNAEISKRCNIVKSGNENYLYVDGDLVLGWDETNIVSFDQKTAIHSYNLMELS